MDNTRIDSREAKDRGTQPTRGDMQEQRGGNQEDQIVGETSKGATNQQARNRNPQGQKEMK